MNIISEIKNKGRFEDGIDTILQLDDDSFELLISRLYPNNSFALERINFFYTSDKCENPNGKYQLGLEREYELDKTFIGKAYFTDTRYSAYSILKHLSETKNTLSPDSKEFERICRILEARGLESFKRKISFNDKKLETVEKTFEILSNAELFEKFLDYENNRKYFTISGIEVEMSVFLKQMGEIFGRKNKYGNLPEDNMINKDFYVPELDKYKERYLIIYDKINIERYINPMYEFRPSLELSMSSDSVIRRGDEPNWTISAELQDAVMGQMPENFTLEEKIMYIYCKLCKEMSYDEGYFFKEHIDDTVYVYDFVKEYLERLRPGSKITCWDFSRLFAKFVNQLNGDVEGVVIAKGSNKGHFLAGFYTDKVSAMVEAINNIDCGTNDLMRAKNGIDFGGIHIISDKNDVIKSALEKVYPLVFDEPAVSLGMYLEKLNQLGRSEKSNNLEKRIEAFIEILKSKGISGNEATQTLKTFQYMGYFGELIDTIYLGKKEESGFGKAGYRRIVLIRPMSEYERNLGKSKVYLLDTSNLALSAHVLHEIRDKIDIGELVYEKKEYAIPQAEMEIDDDRF